MTGSLTLNGSELQHDPGAANATTTETVLGNLTVNFRQLEHPDDYRGGGFGRFTVRHLRQPRPLYVTGGVLTPTFAAGQRPNSRQRRRQSEYSVQNGTRLVGQHN